MNPEDVKDFILQINTHLNDISNEVTDLKVIAAKQEENLKIHMKRSDALETQMDLINAEVRPLLEGLNFFKKLGKFAVGLATVVKAISLFWRR